MRHLLIEMATRVELAKIGLPKAARKQSSWEIILGKKHTLTDFKDRDFHSLVIELGILRPDDTIPKELANISRKIMKEPLSIHGNLPCMGAP